jgi:hypothetical protein
MIQPRSYEDSVHLRQQQAAEAIPNQHHEGAVLMLWLVLEVSGATSPSSL